MMTDDRELLDALWAVLDGQRDARLIPMMRAEEQRVTTLAQRNTVLLRIAERAGDLIAPGGMFASAVDAERRRIAATLGLIGRVGEALERAGIAHAFPKAFQHLPDMGHDIDLLVDESATATARALSDALEIAPVRNTAAHRFAGKHEYAVSGFDASIEIHHGRLGHLGEHAPLAKAALGSRMLARHGGVEAWQLTPPYQLVLAVLQRLYGHMCFRLSDIRTGLALLRSEADVADARRIAAEAGVGAGLTKYSEYISGGARKLPVVGGVYQVPRAGVVAPLFARTFIALTASGRFGQAARIAMIPPMAVTSRVLGI